MNKLPQDFGIPMLTEVLETPVHAIEDVEEIPDLTQLVETLDGSIQELTQGPTKVTENLVSNFSPELTGYPQAEEKEKAEESVDDSAVLSSGIPNQWQDEEWALLQDQITERVLAKIMLRIDSQLELRVRDNLADVLQLAIHQLSEEIRTGLQHTLEDVINDAVKHEITQFKFSKK